MKSLLLLSCLLTCTLAQASSPVYRNWSYLRLDAGSITVEIRTDQRMQRIESLNITQDGKAVDIPRSAYEHIEDPQVHELRIEACESTEAGSCSIVILPYIDQSAASVDEAFMVLSVEIVAGVIVSHATHPVPGEREQSA